MEARTSLLEEEGEDAGLANRNKTILRNTQDT